MKKKNFYLIASILGLLLFIGFLAETEPKTLLGFSINIWIYRLIWLGFSASFFMKYLRIRKEGNSGK